MLILQGRKFTKRHCVNGDMMELPVENQTLKKSVAAIQCKPSQPVSLVQRKLMNVCLFHAYDNLESQVEHVIHIDTLHEYFGYTGNNWRHFDAAFEMLQKILFTWNIFSSASSSEAPSELVSHKRVAFLSSTVWDSEARTWTYSFGPGITDKFHRPDIYAKLNMQIQKKFSGQYSLVLYEQCLRYLGNVNGTRWFSIQDVRDIFAIEKGVYKEFKFLNSAVLKPALNEVNKKSDLHISMDLKKEKRRVVAVKFNVALKNDLHEDDLLLSNQDNSDIYKAITIEFGVVDKTANQMIEHNSREILINAMNYVRCSAAYKNRDPKANLAGYLVSAVKNKYQSATQTMKDAEKARKIQEEEDRKVRELKTKFGSEYKSFKLKAIREQFYSLSEQDQNEVLEDFVGRRLPFCGAGVQADFKRKGIESLIVFDEFSRFATAKYPNYFSQVCTFEEFLSNRENNLA